MTGAIRISLVKGGEEEEEEKKEPPACRGEADGLQLRVRFVPAALLAMLMLRTALALQCVSKPEIGQVM
jgi:hypothetical protein